MSTTATKPRRSLHDRIADLNLGTGHVPDGLRSPSAGAAQTPDDSQNSRDNHATIAVVGTNAGGGDQPVDDAQAQSVPSPGPVHRDQILGLLAVGVDDLERSRIAAENRYRQLTRTEADADSTDDEPRVRGLGLDPSLPEVKTVAAIVEALATAEHQAILSLQRQMRKSPLWLKYAKHETGIGEKTLARLLSAIGDPYWNDLHDRPRTVSELWAYCGFHVIDGKGPVRARGQKVNWSQEARKRAWLIAEACMKQKPGNRYRDLYDATRAHYAEALHTSPCLRCGPAGKPAEIGSPLSKGHQHARALRAIAKEMLKDLWLAARDNR